MQHDLLLPIPLTTKKGGNLKRILIHALTVKHPTGKLPTVGLFKYITISSIHQLFLKFKLMETTLFCYSKTPVTSLECPKLQQAYHPYKNAFGYRKNLW